MDWSGDFNYICPPIKDIIYVVCHILSNPCKGVLVVPFLTSARYWHFLTLENKEFLPIFKKKHIFRPDLYPGFECQKSSFQGAYNVHNKLFIRLVFDST